VRKYKVFLDAGIYIAGAGSALGGSRQILDWCAQRLLQPLTSRQVLTEARRNVVKKLPRAVAALERIIQAVDAALTSEPTVEEISNAAQVVPEKDALILAAARKAEVDHFVTLDRKHLKQPKVQDTVPFPILLPEEFAPLIRAELAKEAAEQGKAAEEES
jgi:predicted nucleic acid-binding protein